MAEVRFAQLLGVSTLVHAGLVGAWALGYGPMPYDVKARSRNVSPVRMVQQGRPPPPKPKPKPKPEPEPEAQAPR